MWALGGGGVYEGISMTGRLKNESLKVKLETKDIPVPFFRLKGQPDDSIAS